MDALPLKRFTFEADLGGDVALYSVVAALPSHPEKRYRKRFPKQITEQYLHHSGRLGADGFAGVYHSARYCVRARGWPGIAYHFWVPYRDVEVEGKRVVYRVNDDTTRSYHGGRGPNTRGISICLQGNTTKTPMSKHQLRCLPQLISYNERRLLGVVPLVFGHFEADRLGDGHAKPSCPGSHAAAWLLGRRAFTRT